MNGVHCIAMYLKISVEDRVDCHDSKHESNSIANQRDLLYRYIKCRPEFSHSRIIELCDDGFSGTNFNRPAVAELLRKAKTKEIDCIIVKNFSRFGSDYIDQVFPFLEIRFISVNDGYDSASCSGTTGGLDVAFRNTVYGYYSSDLSTMTKSGMRTRAKNGEFLSNYAPSGYRKDIERKRPWSSSGGETNQRMAHICCLGS